MRIDLGNFGNNQRQAVSTQVNRGDVTALADAQINAARRQEQTAQQIGQAWGQVGQNLSQFGENVYQRVTEMAQQKASLQIQQKQLFAQGVIQEANDKVSQGLLKSGDVQKFYNDSMSKFTPQDIDGLHGAAAEKFSAGLANVDMQMQGDVHQLYRNAHKVETRSLVDEQIATNERLALKSGDLAQREALYDTPVFQANAREAYGVDWSKRIASAKADLYKNDLRAKIQANRDSIGGLNELDKALADPNSPYANKLTAEDQLSLSNTINSRRTSLEAKAIAAQNHADSVALRRETQAVHADEKMSIRIANGEIPTAQEWEEHNEITKGTSVAGSGQALQQTMVKTQALFGMKPEEAQAQLDVLKLKLDNQGGTANEYQVYNTLQRNVDQRKAELKKNPQAVGAMDSGQPLQPVSAGSALQDPGSYGQALQTRLVNSNALTQKYGALAGQNLLTPDELAEHKAMYKTLTPDQRIQYWRNMQASSSPEIATRVAKEMGDNAPQVQAVASLAVNPAGYATALAVEKGDKMINPPDGLPKVKFETGADQTLLANIKSTYPGISDLQARQLVPVVQRAHVGLGNDPARSISDDTLRAVIGTPAKVSGSTVIVPPNTDENTFIDKMNQGIDGLGAMSLSVRNHLDAGTYNFVPDASGNQMLINSKTMRRVVGEDGRPIVIGVN